MNLEHGSIDKPTTFEISPLDAVKEFERTGAGGIFYIDIDLYDEMPEASMANSIQMAGQLNCPVISID